MTTADGNKYLYTYTGDGQLYEITDTDAEVVYRYQYDSIGRSSEVKSCASRLGMTGRLLQLPCGCKHGTNMIAMTA